MKKLLLSASALCAFAALTVGTASAADLRMPAYRAAPVVAAPMNWTGFYLGFNLGESKDSTSTSESWAWSYLFPANTSTITTLPGGSCTGQCAAFGGQYNTGFANQSRRSSMGFIGGLQWGYNWQVGGLLVGLEGDWNWSNEKDTFTNGGSPVATTVGNAGIITPSTQGWSSEEKIDWVTTWRARLGWAHDSYLWYVTGGVAWAKVENNYILSSTPGSNTIQGGPSVWGLPGGVAAANFSTTKTGWVIGGGVETSIGALFGLGNNNWSMKLEYLYVDLGSVSNTIGTGLVPINVNTPTPPTFNGMATGSTSFYSQNHIVEQIIRVGINYRFSYATVAPVVTKY